MLSPWNETVFLGHYLVALNLDRFSTKDLLCGVKRKIDLTLCDPTVPNAVDI